ncbi:MAG: DUF6108 family protein [Bacteroidaceae bacterium]|nr:DUF6108 family protein [Bacteroidaceae bacterium]
MKRTSLLLWLLMAPFILAMAQKKLHVSPIFEGKVIPKKRMVETLAKGQSMAAYNLSYFRSIKVNVTADEMTRIYNIVKQDVGNLEESEDLEYGRENDIVSYCIKHFPLVGNKQQIMNLNRYLCYQCYESSRGGYNITLVYIEGSAGMQELKRMFKKK